MTNSSYVIDNKFLDNDYLITNITIQFTGDVNEEVKTSVYHFRPETVQDVEQNIQNRIVSELDKIIARNNIERLINEL